MLRNPNRFMWRFYILMGACFLGSALSGCGTMPGWIPSSGASRQQVRSFHDSPKLEGINLVDVDDALTRKLMTGYKTERFSEVFGNSRFPSYLIRPGDVLEVAVWEAPPAMLFGSIALDVAAGSKITQSVTLPAQMVMEDGKITMPFAGRILVAGRAIREIEADITRRLQGQANQPQVIVRVAQRNASSVTVIGDVPGSTQMPLTPKGERLLDAIAKAGGVTQAVTRMSVQVSRQDSTAVMPLDSVIREPKQNIPLMPGDVVTALFQPKSFAVLGATAQNAEIQFEAKGISLAQALARSGGLSDNRADARGVFVFRFENAALVENSEIPPAENGTVPVIYQVNLREPASFFVTQNFPVQDKDVIYVANAPAAELQKFLTMLGSVISPTMNTANFMHNMSR